MRLNIVVLLAAATTGAVAQSASSALSSLAATNTSATPVVVTMTIDDCSTSEVPTMITVTNGVTVTYCPKCELSKSSAEAMATATPISDSNPADVPHTTVYTTAYVSLCTTGSSWYTTPVVYTVTESCPATATPSWQSAPNYVPPGFTTTVVECHACAGPSATAPATLTITHACDCTHTGFYATPAPTEPPAAAPAGPDGGAAPVTQISDGQVQAPTGVPPAGVVSQISDGQAQAPTGAPGAPSADVVSQISDGQAQAPTDAPDAPGAPGAPDNNVVSQISDGQAQTPTDAVSQISDGQIQASAGPPAASGPAGAGSDATTTTVGCPGPRCKATPAVSSSAQPYEPASAASSVVVSSWFGVLGGLVAVFISGLAVFL